MTHTDLLWQIWSRCEAAPVRPTASVGDPAPSCGPIAGLRAVPPGFQTPSRPLKMVHRAARSRRVITPATTTSRPMTPTMNPRVGAGWGVVTTTDVPHRHADSRVHCRRVTRGRRAEKTRPNPAENSTCAPNTISSPDFGCAWAGLRPAGRDFFFVSRRNPYLLAKTRRGLYRMLKSIQKHPASHKTAFFLTFDPNMDPKDSVQAGSSPEFV